MMQTTSCPRCTGPLWPNPFMGSALFECPHCQRLLVLSTDGLSFETSRIRATLPINGEAHHLCTVAPAAGPRVG